MTPRSIRAALVILITCSIGILPVSSYAQFSEVEIKLSGDYFWGEGYGEDRETAINNAKRDLIEKLIVRVESDATLTESERDNSYSSDFESTTNTMSRMELRGLDYLPPKERPNGTWEVIAFVSKNDFDESMAIEGERLLFGLEQALSDEAAGRLNSALPRYFDLLSSTYFYPTPFFTNEEQHGSEAELKSFLQGKINSWINGIDVNVNRVRSLSTATNVEFYFDFEVTYNGSETSFLTFSLDRPGYAAHPVRDGKVEIFSDILPDATSKSYVFNVAPFLPGNLDDDKVRILEEVLPSRELNVQIDFTDIIEIDFEVDNKGSGQFTFMPVIQNVSAYHLEWDFGNGETSTETSPSYSYSSSNAIQTVTLTVNQSEALSISKAIQPNGDVVEIEQEIQVDQEDPDVVDDINDQAETFVVPSSEQRYLNEIIRMKDGQNLTNYLNQLRTQNRILLGRSTDVDDTNLSYLAVINPDNRSVVAILSPVKDGSRTNLSTNTSVDNSTLSETFKGYGSVWFQFK